MPIGPAEAFVLSRVDGATSVLEIAEAAGLEPAAVAATLGELTRLGAVRFDDPVPGDSVRPTRPAARASHSLRIGPIIESSSEVEAHHPAAALYDARELDEAVDLGQDRKRVILEAFYNLDNATHYQLLRVDPSADKRAIKAAYYEVVNVFHPDRYFGKNLGSFKPKLERVFAVFTEVDMTRSRGPGRARSTTLIWLRSRKRANSTTSSRTRRCKLKYRRSSAKSKKRLKRPSAPRLPSAPCRPSAASRRPPARPPTRRPARSPG